MFCETVYLFMCIHFSTQTGCVLYFVWLRVLGLFILSFFFLVSLCFFLLCVRIFVCIWMSGAFTFFWSAILMLFLDFLWFSVYFWSNNNDFPVSIISYSHSRADHCRHINQQNGYTKWNECFEGNKKNERE